MNSNERIKLFAWLGFTLLAFIFAQLAIWNNPSFENWQRYSFTAAQFAASAFLSFMGWTLS